MEESKSLFKTYSSIIWLLCGITVGSILGLVFGKDVAIIKPLGDIFLLFYCNHPLIFFTIASSIASLERTENYLLVMIAVFLCTVLISAMLMIAGVFVFPIHQDIIISKCLWKI
jgi:Na+/H+-dicarboxylate symporter